MIDWKAIAKQSESAKHDHLHKSKLLALGGDRLHARVQFAHFQMLKRAEKFAEYMRNKGPVEPDYIHPYIAEVIAKMENDAKPKPPFFL